MATKAQIGSQDYQRMTFEHDAEFVHGEIVERSLPDEIHFAIQFLIPLHFGLSSIPTPCILALRYA
jgi:hypothetical protein